MKFKDYDRYRSYYCGLCRCLRKQYGVAGRMTLGNDMTFLILLLSGLYDVETPVKIRRCAVHPFKKHQERANEFTEYAASMNLLLFYYKCMDDWADEKKLSRRIFALMISGRVRRIEERFPRKSEVIRKQLERLSEIESGDDRNFIEESGAKTVGKNAGGQAKASSTNGAGDTDSRRDSCDGNGVDDADNQRCASGRDDAEDTGGRRGANSRNGARNAGGRADVCGEDGVNGISLLDEAAGTFGGILAEIFAYRADIWEKDLRRIGFFLGKFIYLLDAYDDIEEDVRRGGFNPLAGFYGKEDFDRRCGTILKLMISECAESFERLPVEDNMEILRNIIYAGVWSQYELTLQKRKEKEEKYV